MKAHKSTLLHIVEADGNKVLAGHAGGLTADETVLVLRKESDSSYRLHAIPIGESQRALQSFLRTAQSTHGELLNVILAVYMERILQHRR